VLWSAVELHQSTPPEPCYGRYPKGFLAWALGVLRVAGREVLHVCSGGMSQAESLGGTRLGLRAAAAPDILADGRSLPFADNTWGAVMIDPPYSVEYAECLYGVEYPRPSHLIAEAARVVRPGGAVAMLHYLVMPGPKEAPFERLFGVTQGLGYRIRAWTIYRKGSRSLFDPQDLS